VIGSWLLVIGSWLLVIGSWLSVIGGWWSLPDEPLSTVHYPLLSLVKKARVRQENKNCC
jgi:hypothetical protein